MDKLATLCFLCLRLNWIFAEDIVIVMFFLFVILTVGLVRAQEVDFLQHEDIHDSLVIKHAQRLSDIKLDRLLLLGEGLQALILENCDTPVPHL